MGCGSGPTEKQINSQWYSACSTNDISYINQHIETYKRTRDARPYQFFQVDENKKILVVPNFTGIMYAIYNGHCDVIDALIEHELDMVLYSDTYLPTNQKVPFDQTFIQDQKARKVFQLNNVHNSICVAQDSNLLELSLLLGNVKSFALLLDKVQNKDREMQKLLLKHCNQSSQNSLLMLTAINNMEAYRILIKYGEMLIKNQFSLTNVYGDNGISYSFKVGNYRFLSYFLGLAHDGKYKTQCDRYINKMKQMKIQPKCDTRSAAQCIQIIENYKNKQYPDPPEWLPVTVQLKQTKKEIDALQDATNFVLMEDFDNNQIQPDTTNAAGRGNMLEQTRSRVDELIMQIDAEINHTDSYNEDDQESVVHQKGNEDSVVHTKQI